MRLRLLSLRSDEHVSYLRSRDNPWALENAEIWRQGHNLWRRQTLDQPIAGPLSQGTLYSPYLVRQRVPRLTCSLDCPADKMKQVLFSKIILIPSQLRLPGALDACRDDHSIAVPLHSNRLRSTLPLRLLEVVIIGALSFGWSQCSLSPSSSLSWPHASVEICG